VIIGETLDGEETTRAELEREIERLGLAGKVVLAGFRADVRQLLAGMAALCMTSDNEGMPNVVLEAMAAGIPVIATAVGGVPDVVRHGETGFLLPPGDEAGIAAGMIRVLDAPEEAARMAAAAHRLMVEERTCGAVARRLEVGYLEGLDGSGG
jgi:glycosyltransferase involved in cell wall biosynthesis